MNEARKLMHQQPGFMAIKNEKKNITGNDVNKQKKWKIDITVLITWIVVIAIAAAIWYLLLMLF